MSGSNSSNKNVIIGILALLLVASLGGNIFQYFHTKTVVVETEKTKLIVDSLTIRKNKLETEYNASIQQLEQFKGQNAQMDSLLQDAYAKIDEQKRKIAVLIDKNADYQILQQRYAELQSTTEFYLREIERLTAENKQLKNENYNLQVKVDQTVTENTDLKGKVDVASKLKASTVSMKGYSVTNGGKEKETDKASRTERISISFTLDENELATRGNHTVYIILKNPEGFVLADAGQSVKKFKTDKGTEINYSRSTTINYDGAKLSKTVTWDQESFGAGVYNVEIYIDNYFAGSQKLMLK